jgi:hypothetical protein
MAVRYLALGLSMFTKSRVLEFSHRSQTPTSWVWKGCQTQALWIWQGMSYLKKLNLTPIDSSNLGLARAPTHLTWV